MTDDRTVHIGPLAMPTRTNHAETNGCQVISATAMPEPVLNALVALVDALGAAFRVQNEAEQEADKAATRRPCPAHLGQWIDYCGPCRSEHIGADR